MALIIKGEYKALRVILSQWDEKFITVRSLVAGDPREVKVTPDELFLSRGEAEQILHSSANLLFKKYGLTEIDNPSRKNEKGLIFFNRTKKRSRPRMVHDMTPSSLSLQL